ncbi:MAG: hypothetical protein GXN92_01620, partial [Candidatus Micrarchaeota archaeon]|nr:hypothetical protein [Candidatus Micrarchaeota archaeon]
MGLAMLRTPEFHYSLLLKDVILEDSLVPVISKKPLVEMAIHYLPEKKIKSYMWVQDPDRKDLPLWEYALPYPQSLQVLVRFALNKLSLSEIYSFYTTFDKLPLLHEALKYPQSFKILLGVMERFDSKQIYRLFAMKDAYNNTLLYHAVSQPDLLPYLLDFLRELPRSDVVELLTLRNGWTDRSS